MPNMSDWLGLSGRTAVITGAGGGIGRAVAIELATAGMNPVVLDRTQELVDETLSEMSKLGLTGTGFACDVTDEEQVSKIAQQVGKTHVLVNTAGILRPGTLAELSTAEWQALINVNLTGYFVTSRAFVPKFKEAGSGSIVHIASVSGTNPQPASGAYSVSKAGVLMLSKQLAFELGPEGIRSNTVSPGLVRTPLTEAYYNVGDVAARRDAAVPVRRVAKPHDIADVVTFLASDRSRYITGADIVADGGFTQTLMSTIPRPGFGD